MNKRHTLKQKALAAAECRGHRLGTWVDIGDWRTSAECRKCGAWVTVNTRLLPNSIEIGGQAVSIDCT